MYVLSHFTSRYLYQTCPLSLCHIYLFFKDISNHLLTYFPFLRQTLVLNEYKKIMEYVNLHEGAFTNGHLHKIKPGSKRCDNSRCEVH